MVGRIVFLFALILVGAHASFAQLRSIDIIVDNDIICEGDTAQLNIEILQIGDNNLTFDWTNAKSLNDGEIVNPKAFPTQTTLYYVTVTDEDNDVELTDSIEIIVLPEPNIYAGDDGTVCENQPFTVLNAFTNNSIEFTWSHDGLGELIQDDTYSPTYIPVDGELGVVNIMLTSGGILFCRDVTDTLKLTIEELPTVKFDIAVDTICNDESFVFNEPVVSNVQNFVWTHNGQGILLNSHTYTPEYVPDEFESGNVRIMIICNGIASCIQVYDTLDIHIGPKPTIEFGVENAAICYGNNYNFSDVTIANSSGFEWSHNGAGVLDDNETINPVYVPSVGETGAVEVVLTVFGSNNCSPVSDTVTLDVSVPQEISIVADTMVCSNETLILSVPDGLTYLWSTGETSSSIQVNPQQDTFYAVTTTNEVGCVLVDTINVKVSDITVEKTNDPLICAGEEVTIAVVFSADRQYLWNTGETVNAITVSPGVDTDYDITVTNNDGCSATETIKVLVNESPEITVDEAEEPTTVEVLPSFYSDYTFSDADGIILQQGFINTYDYGSDLQPWDSLYVKVTNDLGCIAEELYIIPVEEVGLPPGSGLANAFSPNGDGTNDVFLNGQRIVVFDRSDKILFEGNTGWDGRYSGKDMPAGTYLFVAFNDTGDPIYKGTVTIVR